MVIKYPRSLTPRGLPHLPQSRLTDKLRAAFHVACDEGDVEIAKLLLSQLDQLIHHPRSLPTGLDRRRPEPFIGPAERLANLMIWRPHC